MVLLLGSALGGSDDTEAAVRKDLASAADAVAAFAAADPDGLHKMIATLADCLAADGRVVVFGNGGSAATASHIASDLAKGAICKDKPRLKAHALVDNLPLFSAWANDSDYADVFSEQLENEGC